MEPKRVLLLVLSMLITSFSLFSQSVTSDKEDYAPGEIAIITGTGWIQDQFVNVHFDEEPVIDHHHGWHDTPVAPDGTFRIEYLILERHLGVKFTVNVEGQTSGTIATTVFYDGRAEISSVSPSPFSPNETPGVKDNVTITGFNNSMVGGNNPLNNFNVRIFSPSDVWVWGSSTVIIQNGETSNFLWNGQHSTPAGSGFVPDGTYSVRTYNNNTEYQGSIRATVIVDNTNPTFTTFPSSVTLQTTANQCTSLIGWSEPTASDANGIESIVQIAGPSNNTSVGPGLHTITYRATDNAGNLITQSFVVTVEDKQNPVFTFLPASIVKSADPDKCSAIFTWPTPVATDNCGTANVQQIAGPVSGSEFPIGQTTIMFRATDSYGNTTEQSFTVTVNDTQAPLVILPYETLSVNADQGECGAVVNWLTASVSDNCPGASVAQTSGPTSGSYLPTGNTIVTYTATDANGLTSSASITISVLDVEAPVAPSLEPLTAECSLTVGAPVASDNCDGDIQGETNAPLQYSAQGTFQIEWRFTDSKGNSSLTVQTVIIKDETAPVPDQTVLPIIVEECAARLSAPTATDNCKGLITGTTLSPVDYTVQGTYTINWIFNDGNGNVSTQTQTLIVEDVTPPAPAVVTLPVVSGQCSASVTAPLAQDNCKGLILGTTTDPTSYTEQGSYTITWTYDDGNGNLSTQPQTVIVDDTTAPVPDEETLNVIAAECSALAVPPTATDNCKGPIVGTTSDPTEFNSQGTFYINWTFVDGNGNTASQAQTVIVKDVTPPVPDAALLPVISEECSASVAPPSATDNCAGPITATTTDPTVFSGQGTFTIIWSYADGNGNTTLQTQTVIIEDITPPVPEVAILADVNAECGVTVIAPTARDNCKETLTATTNDPTSYSQQGTYMIHWTFNDANGNTSSQTQNVIIDDVTAPAINNLPASLTVNNDAGKCGAIINYAAPSASDNCTGVILTRTAGPASGELFPIGTTTVTYSATDVGGNTVSESFTVTVNNPAPVLGTPTASVTLVPVNDNVTLTVPYNDLSPVTISINWDDMTSTVRTGVVTGGISEIHKYTSPGVYAVGITVTDECNSSLSATTVFQYIVVYDPSGGFVTGGGWINSPVGAYVPDPSLTGKANFGFVSKYLKGASVPTGDTEFQFHVGNLNFKSTSYEWLVVAGAKAQFKGKGTINGTGSYNFLISAIDGLPDKFRIKITNGSESVYDNQFGAADNSDASTAISGGSIVVHDAKAKGAAKEQAGVISELYITSIEVFPNPVDETIKVSVHTPMKTAIQFNLIDSNGRSLKSQTDQVNGNGEYAVEVGELGLRSGLYFLRIAQGNGVKTIKVFKK
jgi:hypothetical protein